MPADPNELNHQLANFIKKRMSELGIERVDLTEKFKISTGTVSRWLNGNLGENPKLETFIAFSDAIQSPLWRVLEEAGYRIERPTDPADSDRQLARQIEATPELRPIVRWLFELDIDDRAAVMTFVEVLQRRRADRG